MPEYCTEPSGRRIWGLSNVILLLAFTGSLKKSLFWITLVIVEIAISILFFIRSNKSRKKKHVKEVYYKHLYYGGKSILLRSYIVFATIPYYSKLYMDAFFRTLYRLYVSHKNLLNWITADDAEKLIKDTLGNYIRNFIFNYIIGVGLIVLLFRCYYL